MSRRRGLIERRRTIYRRAGCRQDLATLRQGDAAWTLMSVGLHHGDAKQVYVAARYCEVFGTQDGGDLGKHCLQNSLGRAKAVTIRPPEYTPPPIRAYTDFGWACAALTAPATFIASWIYCAVTWGFLLGFFLGWIPSLILALVVAIATIYLWPLAASAFLYEIFRVFDIHPELLVLVGIIAIATVWWWHVARSNNQP